MTLDEKIAQLTQLTSSFFEGSNAKGDPTGPMNELGINKEIVQNCGICHWCFRSKRDYQYSERTS